jgi:hypothetical protein
MIRVDTRPRRRNSMKADVERRFPSHLQWIRGRSCVVEVSGGCEGRMEAAHVDHAGGKGVGIKVSDTKAVPLCQHHHAELHRGAKSFEAKHRINLVDAAYAYAEKSPHRVLWADIPGLRR